MLKEININDLIHTEDPIYVIMGSTVYTQEEFFDDEIRILIDEGAGAEDLEEEMIGEECQIGEENELTVPEEEEPKVIRRGGRKSYKDRVLQAWNEGCRTPEEIMEYTGCSYNTAAKYMPEAEE